jgi:hypothetical protein
VVIGITGAGKSHYAKKRVMEHVGRVAVWDIKREYPLEQVTIEEFMSEASANLLDRADLRIAVVPSTAGYADLEELSEKFAAFGKVMRTAHECLLVVDEIGILDGAALRELVYLAALGRDWGLAMVLVAQRAVQIPLTARSQASRIVSFRQTTRRDIDALADIIGTDLAEQVPALPRHKCVEWDEADAFGVELKQ